MTSKKIKVDIPDTNPDVLKARFRKGLEIANNLWQKQGYDTELDNVVRRLELLNYAAGLYGVKDCPFGECKFGDDFICFVCTRRN
jgi:hypothetical protein